MTCINKKIRIAVICPGFGTIPRGIETVVKEVFFLLAKNNPDYLIDIYGNKKIDIPYNNLKIKTGYLGKFDSILSKLYSKISRKIKFPANEKFDFNFLCFAFSIIPKLFINKYDIIFNNGGIYSAIICRILKKIFKVPYVHSGHAGINNLELLLAKMNPSYYIASTIPAEKWIKNKIKNLNVSVIPNGINKKQFYPFKSNLNLNLKKPIFLFVGALTPQKQPDLVLKAFAENNIGSLIILGNGPLKEKIEKLKKNHNLNKNNFFMKDFVEYDELPMYFNYSDYFVLPSQNETFGIVYIMAIACNKPCIAENNPIQKSILKEAALYCKTNDLKNLKKCMIEITQKDFKNYPSELSKNYYWENIVLQYKNIIQNLTKK